MRTEPPSRRRYDGSRRQVSALETRRAVTAAARRLFLADGYVRTTVAAIAREAGVAPDTVYAVVGPKPALFRHLIETAISGGDEPVPALERPYVLEIRAELDATRKLERYAAAATAGLDRMAPLFAVLRDAAASDAELAALWTGISERRAANMRPFVSDVQMVRRLRDGMSIEEAADIVWTMASPEVYLMLVRSRGWTAERFERWLVETWVATLLPDPVPGD